MENYIKKAADAFLVERPYGMRVDYRKKGYIVFRMIAEKISFMKSVCLNEYLGKLLIL